MQHMLDLTRNIPMTLRMQAWKIAKLLIGGLVGALPLPVPAQTVTADAIFVNGRITTLDASDSNAVAVAVKDGK
ncbi:MAG: hypothetical protein EBY18_07765, partial [Alphaproteobacteria bacterium]|nr:hypothetical protein [Alphaproteobacteria bacterium]